MWMEFLQLNRFCAVLHYAWWDYFFGFLIHFPLSVCSPSFSLFLELSLFLCICVICSVFLLLHLIIFALPRSSDFAMYVCCVNHLNLTRLHNSVCLCVRIRLCLTAIFCFLHFKSPSFGFASFLFVSFGFYGALLFIDRFGDNKKQSRDFFMKKDVFLSEFRVRNRRSTVDFMDFSLRLSQPNKKKEAKCPVHMARNCGNTCKCFILCMFKIHVIWSL